MRRHESTIASWRPARPLADVHVGDDAEIDRAVCAAIRPVLRRAAFAADRLPPGRREWLNGFLYRSVEGALLQSHPDAQPCDLDGLWASFAHDLSTGGVVPTILGITRLANDADGEDERGGWARHGYALLAAFLRDVPDQRHLFASVMAATDPDEWRGYPNWFGALAPDAAAAIAHRRATATRWIHPSGDTADILRGVLDDAEPPVRHIAAVRLVELLRDATDAHVVRRLREAAADPDWIWSRREYFDGGSRGAQTAARRLRWLERGFATLDDDYD